MVNPIDRERKGMISQRKLDRLQKKRHYGMGRMLLLARKDFLERLAQAMRDLKEELPSSSATLLPFVDLQGTRSTEIARRMGVSKQAAAKAVKDLESVGLLMRERDETDARAFLIRFTPYGLSYMVKLHDAIDQVEADYTRLLGPEQVQALRRALAVIAYNGLSPEGDD